MAFSGRHALALLLRVLKTGALAFVLTAAFSTALYLPAAALWSAVVSETFVLRSPRRWQVVALVPILNIPLVALAATFTFFNPNAWSRTLWVDPYTRIYSEPRCGQAELFRRPPFDVYAPVRTGTLRAWSWLVGPIYDRYDGPYPTREELDELLRPATLVLEGAELCAAARAQSGRPLHWSERVCFDDHLAVPLATDVLGLARPSHGPWEELNILDMKRGILVTSYRRDDR